MKLLNLFSTTTKYNIMLRLFTFVKVPLIFFIRPTIMQLDEEICTIKIPFKRSNKNHINSMFVGVLTSAADCTAIFAGMQKTQMKRKNVVFAMKNMHVDFLKRAESDTYFTCAEGLEIEKYVQEAIDTGERINRPITITAICPDTTGDELVAKFTVTLSLKSKQSR